MLEVGTTAMGNADLAAMHKKSGTSEEVPP